MRPARPRSAGRRLLLDEVLDGLRDGGLEVEELHPRRGDRDDDHVESVVAYYREQIVASQQILRTIDLDAPCACTMIASNLRWVAVHMIEETARHAGHADIIRETINHDDHEERRSDAERR